MLKKEGVAMVDLAKNIFFTHEPSADVGHGVILMRSIILLAFTPTWTMREVSPYSECEERAIGRGRHSLWYSDT